MITIQEIRNRENKILMLGEHPQIIQSVLDFDYLSDKSVGSIAGIVSGRRGYGKYFYGRGEILIPMYASLADFAKIEGNSESNLWFFNNLSGRRTLSSVLEILELGGDSLMGEVAKGQGETPKVGGVSPFTPGFAGGVIFAEGVPELHSLKIIEKNNQLIIGPASVGLIIPGTLKLGAIGGITPDQIKEGKLTEPGHLAVVSGSGGMTNELINVAIQNGHRLSFALSYGGDRFPVLSPRDAFLLAESDPQTKAILYYGELGGEDEYELVKLKAEGKFTKKVIAHIAGTVASLFPESPQFGHAKAKADKQRSTATAKREALKSAGFEVSNSFNEFIEMVSRFRS